MKKPQSILAHAIAALLLGAASTQAAVKVWIGAGADANWSTPANWLGNVAPVNTDDLQFSLSNKLVNNNDVGAFIGYNSLAFNGTAGAFTLGGDAIVLGPGGITNNSVNLQTLSFNDFNPLLGGLGHVVSQTWNAASGDLSITANSTFLVSHTLTIDGGFNTSISGAINQIGGQAGTLVKNGTGTLTLGGANSYSGGTTISGGTVKVSNDNNLGAAAGGITFNNNATLQTLAGIISARAVTINAGGGIFYTDDQDSTLSGVISGAGRLTVMNDFTAFGGSLTLTNSNTYLGGTTIQDGGIVVISADEVLHGDRCYRWKAARISEPRRRHSRGSIHLM